MWGDPPIPDFNESYDKRGPAKILKVGDVVKMTTYFINILPHLRISRWIVTGIGKEVWPHTTISIKDSSTGKSGVDTYRGFWPVVSAPETKMYPNYPHICPKCKGPAYVGFNVKVDCMRGCF